MAIHTAAASRPLLPLLLVLSALLAVSTAGSSSYSSRSPSARRSAAAFARRRPLPSSVSDVVPRGGSTQQHDDDEEDEDDAARQAREAEEEALKIRAALTKYRSDQSILLQLRSTLLSEALAARGVPLPTLRDCSTADGDKPAEACDWDCALSTDEEPKSCLYSFDAEPGTKVVAPLGTDQWISLSALNRLRRTDPTKVEPMWHGRYAVLSSWFSDESEFSLLQHVGLAGFLVSSVLLDLGGGVVLRSLLVLGVLSVLCVAMPLLEYVVGRILVSGVLWSKWLSWHRIAHAALPLKLLLGQMAWKYTAGAFGKLEGAVRERAVDWECAILEECVPVTVGEGAMEEDEDFDVELDEELDAAAEGEYDVGDDDLEYDDDYDDETEAF